MRFTPTLHPQAFTASEIARSTGTDRFTVRRSLIDIPPAREVVREGNRTQAFHKMDLPEVIRAAVEPYSFTDISTALETIASSWPDRAHPTDKQAAHLLDCGFHAIDDLVKRGALAKPIKGLLVKWLVEKVPGLAQRAAGDGVSLDGMRRMVNRELSRWRAGGRKASALHDGRIKAGKARRAAKLPKDEVEMLASAVAFAPWDKGGRSKINAWLSNYHKLSEATRTRFTSKSGMPVAFRKAVAPLVHLLREQHHHKKGAALNGSYLDRDWSNIYAGDWYSCDDFTLPVYCYDDETEQLTRGQFLPMIDVKSQRVLDFVFLPGKSYDAASIRILISRVCSRHGLPRKGFHFEQGVWKNSHLVGGGSKSNPWTDVGETFAQRLGIQIQHARLARSKTIERLGGIWQDMMESEPGYVGRNEIIDKFEDVQRQKLEVAATRKKAGEAGFRTVAQWTGRLHEIMEGYNARARTSDVMGGTMSPDAAWESCQPRDAQGNVETIVKLPPDLRYLLAAHKASVTVTRAGIRLFAGKFRYDGEITGSMRGQTVIAWFDPQHPETLAITDLNGENVQTLPRLHAVKAFEAWDATPDQIREATALVNAANGVRRRIFSDLKLKYSPPVRALLADPGQLQKGREIDRQRQEHIAEHTGSPQIHLSARSSPVEFEINSRCNEAARIGAEMTRQRLDVKECVLAKQKRAEINLIDPVREQAALDYERANAMSFF